MGTQAESRGKILPPLLAALRARGLPIWRRLSDPFLPAYCGACDQRVAPHAAPICESCCEALGVIGENYCRRCGAPQGPYVGAIGKCTACRDLGADWPFLEVVALGEHKSCLRDAVVKLKFHGRHRNAEQLGSKLGELLLKRGLEVDAVVPLPLARQRRFERGFDQAELIAGALAAKLSVPLLQRALKRKRRTTPQTTLSAAQRKANMRSAFGKGTDAGAITGLRVVLVDDVLTTGATLEAAGKVLKRLKPAELYGAVLSRSEH